MGSLAPYKAIAAEVRQFDGVYAGRLLVPDAIVNFRSDSREGVVAAFQAAVDAYLSDPARYRRERPSVGSSERPQPTGELRYDTWGRSELPRRT